MGDANNLGKIIDKINSELAEIRYATTIIYWAGLIYHSYFNLRTYAEE